MNDLYEAARKRVREIREEEAALNEFIRAHEKALRVLGRQAQGSLFDADGEPSDEAAAAAAAELEARVPPAVAKRVTDNPKPSHVIDAAIAILREGGKPMSRRELHVALKERGLEVRGASPIKALGTMLWRGRDRLAQIEGYGYWPIGDAFEPAGYKGNPG